MLFFLLLTAIAAAQTVCQGCSHPHVDPTPEERLDAIETELDTAQLQLREALQLMQDLNAEAEAEAEAELAVQISADDTALDTALDVNVGAAAETAVFVLETILSDLAVDSAIESDQ